MKQAPDILNVHGVVPLSRANGPGDRMVIWLQGCNLKCPGCFNPETHPRKPQRLMTVDAVFDRIRGSASTIEGITLSGGEPLEQINPLINLLQRVRFATSLSVVLFSGYELEKINKMKKGEHLLKMVDVLIAGPYIEHLRLSQNLTGSSNQQIHFLTDRYRMQDIARMPAAEVQIDLGGNIIITGIGGISKDRLPC
jgi:anaerobic ribonucleoside-triphosphate reductase activating protein